MIKSISSPAELKAQFPPPAFTEEARRVAARIVTREDARLAAIVGPCSIHDIDASLEYARRLSALEVDVFPIMRLFIEKPRTTLGWKGLVYDPKMDGSHDLSLGLKMARFLMVEVLKMGVPIAVELLDPLIAPFFDDLVTWGVIGARTSASQPHRQMASNLPFPVGFKNDTSGRTDEAIHGILAARAPHSFLSIDPEGRLRQIHSKGNSLTHLILRGADTHPNYERANEITDMGVLIDCSHGNSNKDFRKQANVLEEVLKMEHPNVIGFMLESHLFEGRQEIGPALRYGVSVTDGCMGWEKTERLLTSISLVQS